MADFQWTDLIPAAASVASAYIGSRAVNKAASAQNKATQQGIAGYAPYAQLGTDAASNMRNLLGLGTPAQQQTAIDAIKSSPEYQTMLQQGENAILQNASATGGLRGGNTQAALAQFAPNLLNTLVNQRVNTLTGLAGQGANIAGNTANLYSQQGAVNAGQSLGNASLIGNLLSGLGNYAAYKWGTNNDNGISNQQISNMLFD